MNKHFEKHSSGLYVAEDGEVFVPKSGVHSEHYTYGYKRKDGYREVRYQGKQYKVHRLVAECYIPNPENKPCIDHIIPVSMGGTNDVSNLRWCTHDENNNNPLTRQNNSEAKKGKKQSEVHIRKKAEAKKIPIIGTHKTTGEIVEFDSMTDAWMTLNINKGDICSCIKGRLKSAGGYVWVYA